MKKYLIENNGEDTISFEIELTDEELKTVIRLIKANNDATKYGYEPTINIYDRYFYDDDGKPTTYKQTIETTEPMKLED